MDVEPWPPIKPPVFLSTLALFLFCHILFRVSTDVKCRERHVALVLSGWHRDTS